ncbi:MAG: ferritin family protein [Deltaproteobacteria bacterium]|nr:ferritin family protein [Deltaproteobacteria bacterium]MDH3383520.1 ferritin family protein [Deltaproteobacteria bacterium]
MKVAEEALKFLNLGIESELAAYVFYRRSSKTIDDENVRKVLDGLAMDEKQHFLQLEEAYDKNVRSEMWAPYRDIMTRDGLPDIDEQMQETHKELLGKIPNLKSKKDVLEIALALEKEAADLYRNASSKAKDPEIKKIFDHLVAFEKVHVNKIEKALAAL